VHHKDQVRRNDGETARQGMLVGPEEQFFNGFSS
jgi:hypothetical protein